MPVLRNIISVPVDEGGWNQAPGRCGPAQIHILNDSIPADGGTDGLPELSAAKPFPLGRRQVTLVAPGVFVDVEVEPENGQITGRPCILQVETLPPQLQEVLGTKEVIQQVELTSLEAKQLSVSFLYIVNDNLVQIG